MLIKAFFKRNFSWNIKSNCYHNSAGAVLVFGLFAITLILAFGALLIDSIRLEETVNRLQAIADGAALAGSMQLRTQRQLDTDGKERWYIPSGGANAALEGWELSKLAVFAILNANSIPGVTDELDPNTATTAIASYSLKADSHFRFVNYHFPNMDLQIERGIFEPTNSASPGSTLTFKSLDKNDTTTNEVDPKDASANPGGICKNGSFESCVPRNTDPPNVQYVANAVRVTITVAKIPSLLPSVFHFQNFSNVTRSSVSSLDF